MASTTDPLRTAEPAPSAQAASEARAYPEGHYQVLHTVDAYERAQETVDLLSDEGFPVERIRIIGRDIVSREQITGRMTKGRAAGLGAAAGAWFGLLLGLIFALFSITAAWFVLIVTAVLMGAFWGAVVGFAGHALTRGRRDFRSMKVYEAARYEIQVEGPWAAEASRILAAGRSA